MRITPTREEHVQFPDDATLESLAAAVPPEGRLLIHSGGWKAIGPDSVLAPFDTSEFPVFSHEDELIGIYVSKLGVIPREIYDDPATDLEQMARDKWGEEEYRDRLARQEWSDQQSEG